MHLYMIRWVENRTESNSGYIRGRNQAHVYDIMKLVLAGKEYYILSLVPVDPRDLTLDASCLNFSVYDILKKAEDIYPDR